MISRYEVQKLPSFDSYQRSTIQFQFEFPGRKIRKKIVVNDHLPNASPKNLQILSVPSKLIITQGFNLIFQEVSSYENKKMYWPWEPNSRFRVKSFSDFKRFM